LSTSSLSLREQGNGQIFMILFEIHMLLIDMHAMEPRK